MNDLPLFKICNSILMKCICNNSTVIIPDGVKEIDSDAFNTCKDVLTIYIPDSVKRIGCYAFTSCSALKSVIIGNGIKTIPTGCFMNLCKLESVTVSDKLEIIDDLAFKGCCSLKTFYSKKSVNKGEYTIESQLTYNPLIINLNVSILKRIGNFAFYGCHELNPMMLINNTLEIEEHSFPSNCLAGCFNEENPKFLEMIYEGDYSLSDDLFEKYSERTFLDGLEDFALNELTEEDGDFPLFDEQEQYFAILEDDNSVFLDDDDIPDDNY
jgi:hypothetical protein